MGIASAARLMWLPKGAKVSFQLSYDVLYEYDLNKSGITLEVALRSGGLQERQWAKFDSGSSFCIFQREVGERLGLEIESELEDWVSTPLGLMRVFGHELLLETLGITFEAVVYFAAHHGLPRNVLGRSGWMQRLKLGVIDYEGKLYAGTYDSW